MGPHGDEVVAEKFSAGFVLGLPAGIAPCGWDHTRSAVPDPPVLSLSDIPGFCNQQRCGAWEDGDFSALTKKTCDYAGMGPGDCSQQGPCRLPVGESMVGNRAGVGYMGVPGGAAEMTALLQFLGAMPPLPSGACKDLGHIFQL